MNMLALKKKKKAVAVFFSIEMNLCHKKMLTIFKFLLMLFCSVCFHLVGWNRMLPHCSSERLNKSATNENFSTVLPALSFMCLGVLFGLYSFS